MLFQRVLLFCHGIIGVKGLSWPDGKYGLPQSLSGCPDSENVQWATGWRRQHLERLASLRSNTISELSHINASILPHGEGIQRSFCIKTIFRTQDTNIPWPDGKYCIYKYGESCPKGMKSGSVHWDDNNENNSNSYGGILPEGNYDNDTTIEYCCQGKGDWDTPIDLPVEKPFYLLPYEFSVCQHVKWAVRSMVENITYHTEEDNNGDKLNGEHVHLTKQKSLITTFYCYYKACRSIFRNFSGSFSSYNTSYQYCSWTIAVKETLVISLAFPTFSIPDCNMNYLDIYQGYDMTGPLMARYCGSNATKPMKLNLTTNILFVMLKTGGNFDGFVSKYVRVKAEYKTMVNSKECHEVLSSDVDNGSFTSPLFPEKDYPPNQNCSWTISAKRHQVISLMFDYFYLPNCKDNYVDIHDGPDTRSRRLTRICKESSARKSCWNSTGNSLYVVYKSGENSTIGKRKTVGFQAKYEVTKRPATTEKTEKTENTKHVEQRLYWTPTYSMFKSSDHPITQPKTGSYSSEKVVLIGAATLISFVILLLIIFIIILYRSYWKSKETRTRKQSENPMYERTSGYSSNNPLYSSTPVSLYEEVKMKKKSILTDAGDGHVICNPESDHGTDQYDVNEKHYETPEPV